MVGLSACSCVFASSERAVLLAGAGVRGRVRGRVLVSVLEVPLTVGWSGLGLLWEDMGTVL